ncbi:lipoprotein releasing system, transmembrane protein, LolC/E family [gamma proteobacterium HTCC5015]|nr:lipoprotein releasing system, transmembrane protein, LolC/E family [gamma proteobacterium HTCC5015]
MFQPFELFIGLRYTRAKRRNHFISFISLISILGIALGVWALITVISVMNGFESELRERILGMTSHATISAYNGAMRDWDSVIQQAETHPEVIGAAPYVESQLMLLKGGEVNGAIARGVLPQQERKVADVEDKMVVGSFDSLKAGEWNIVLGSELARALRLRLFDKVTVVSPQTNITAAGFIPRLKTFTLTGVFELGMNEYDSGLVFLHAADAGKLMRMPEGGVTGVRLKLTDMFEAGRIGEEVANEVGEQYWVSDWTQRHANFFKAIKTERRVMFIILTLIVAVAAFNIISTLIMVVTDKQSDIAILRTLGASPRSIMKVFIIQGTMVGVLGTLIGMVTGALSGAYIGDVIAYVEQLFQFKFLAPDVYYISDLPSELRWPNVFMAGGFAFLVSILATLYPAWRAARVQPAEALRYE